MLEWIKRVILLLRMLRLHIALRMSCWVTRRSDGAEIRRHDYGGGVSLSADMP